MPEHMFVHAGSGYAGHGTLCGTLGVSACLINLVIYDEEHTYKTVVDRLMWWYAQMEFPTERFDDLSEFPGQHKAQAMTPLCHSSVSSWTMAGGTVITAREKYERCAKVAGEVVYTTTLALNEYFSGTWKAPKWEPSEEIAHCLNCHGPEKYPDYSDGLTQQGHMECLLCHKDHTE